MELRHTEIPLDFLRTLPEGIKLVKRHGKSFLVVEEVSDADGASLITHTVHIHGEPTIKLDIRIGDSAGSIFVDAFWGSHSKLYSFIPEVREGLVEAGSPASGASLMTDWECKEAGCTSNRAILLHLPGATNRIYVCARLGCPGHEMRIQSIPEEVTESVSSINFFGEGEDEWFQGI